MIVPAHGCFLSTQNQSSALPQSRALQKARLCVQGRARAALSAYRAPYFYDKYKLLSGDDLANYDLIERLEKLDAIGLIHWPKKEGGMPQGKRLLEDALGIPLQDV
jgi:hypothetical protein